MNKIRIAILGYGNLGKGVDIACDMNEDMELKYVFTRRNPEDLKILSETASVKSVNDILNYKDEIDVLIICGGSATDLPEQTPHFTKYFNTVDSFDTHARIPEHFNNVDKVAKEANKISVISVGWDPGVFSMQRLLFNSVLPSGTDYTFWGKGVSQGHSDAVRRIAGVKNAIQYTIPIDEAVEKARSGNNPELTTRDKHLRECFVVLEDGTDKEKVENEIKTMKNYFADYNTVVHFISEEEFKRDHNSMPHGGFVIRSGNTDKENKTKHVMEFSLKLDSNPQFTASVLCAFARAAYKMNKEGLSGCKTAFDIPLSYLSNASSEELRAHLL